MAAFERRTLLKFLGLSGLAPSVWLSGHGAAAGFLTTLPFTPVRLPHALSIYSEGKSFLPTGVDGAGEILPPDSPAILPHYTVVDDVVVPPEFTRYLIVSWGDRVFPDPDHYVGYNCDYTAFVPDGKVQEPAESGWLIVNHESVSYPFSNLAPTYYADLRFAVSDKRKILKESDGRFVASGLQDSFDSVVGQAADNPHPFSLPTVADLRGSSNPLAGLAHDPDRQRLLAGECKYNTGLSILRLRRAPDSRDFAVAKAAAGNRRLHGLSGLAINRDRRDSYRTVTDWGPAPHQQGDRHYLTATGPAADEVFPGSADGLGARIIGTAYNCSGGVTPWGTVLTCEENMHGGDVFWDGVQEAVDANGHQLGYLPDTTGAVFGLVGEKYGWVVEVDPAKPDRKAAKHTALGRFRHENVALRVEAGAPLIAYMGDDRRGGHTWKWVSRGTVSDVTDPGNSALFADGTLYAAKFNADGTGYWLPLTLDAPISPTRPSEIAEKQLQQQGKADKAGRVSLPRRRGIAGADGDGGGLVVDVTNEAEALQGPDGYLSYAAGGSGTLADFYAHQGAILTDAFLAANLIGGTPTARPEDLELVPGRPHEILIAYTSGAAGNDGYADSRIFNVAKMSEAANASGPWGGLYKITENSLDSVGQQGFTWSRLHQSGEEAAGAGFANLDNLAFDADGNLFGVTDISTSRQNALKLGRRIRQRSVDHSTTRTGAARALAGVFGNNFMFYLAASGDYAGQIVPFAYGPMRSELTGPTFIDDTLILSVQHPGENAPINGQAESVDDAVAEMELLDLDGRLVRQKRVLPHGSNWPSHLPGDRFASGPLKPPRPSVIGIRRK